MKYLVIWAAKEKYVYSIEADSLKAAMEIFDSGQPVKLEEFSRKGELVKIEEYPGDLSAIGETS